MCRRLILQVHAALCVHTDFRGGTVLQNRELEMFRSVMPRVRRLVKSLKVNRQR